MRVVKLLLGAVIVTGCYRYVPLATPQLQPGTRVSAELTDSGTLELARYLGPGVFLVGGRLLGNNDRELSLAVFTVQSRDGQESYWKGEAVTLPRPVIGSLRERRLAVGRSAVMAGAFLAGAVALLDAFGVIGPQTGPGGTPPPSK